jgi:hypothetical protein
MVMSPRRATAIPPCSSIDAEIMLRPGAATSRKKEFHQGERPHPTPKTPVLFCEAVPLPDHAPVGTMDVNNPQYPVAANLIGAGHRIAARQAVRLCRGDHSMISCPTHASRQEYLYSISSSVTERSAGDMSRPSALAVVRLMTRSNLLGCSTGISPGLVPCKILSTISAVRRNKTGMPAP